MHTYESHTDMELVHLLRHGDERAFTELVHRYWKPLLFVAVRKLDNQPLAEETVQDLLAEIWLKRDRLHIETTVGTYLSAALKYKVIDARRRVERYRAMHEAGAPQEALDDSTREQLAFEDLRAYLEQLVSELPERCQFAFRLKEAGLTGREIAAHMHISEKAVERHITRANRQLRLGIKNFLSVFF